MGYSTKQMSEQTVTKARKKVMIELSPLPKARAKRSASNQRRSQPSLTGRVKVFAHDPLLLQIDEEDERLYAMALVAAVGRLPELGNFYRAKKMSCTVRFNAAFIDSLSVAAKSITNKRAAEQSLPKISTSRLIRELVVIGLRRSIRLGHIETVQEMFSDRSLLPIELANIDKMVLLPSPHMDFMQLKELLKDVHPIADSPENKIATGVSEDPIIRLASVLATFKRTDPRASENGANVRLKMFAAIGLAYVQDPKSKRV